MGRTEKGGTKGSKTEGRWSNQLSDDQTIQMPKTFFKMGHVCISRAI